jgi:hypothetical protein
MPQKWGIIGHRWNAGKRPVKPSHARNTELADKTREFPFFLYFGAGWANYSETPYGPG